MTPAGFWRRFAAHTLDVTVLGLFWLLAGILLVLGLTALGLKMPVALADADQYELHWNVLTLLVGWLYFALQESSWQQATIGKRLIGIEVSDLAGELAAAAAGSYYARHGELPVSLEEAGYVPLTDEGAPLVSIDAREGHLVIAARDGSVFLEMVPVSSQDGLAWMCTASPDSDENYPPVCGR